MTSALKNFPVTSSAERAQSFPVLDELSSSTREALAQRQRLSRGPRHIPRL